MATRELVEDDVITGVREHFIFDEVTGEFTIAREQFAGPTLELAHELRKTRDKHTPWKEGQHVALIPPVVVEKLMERGIFRDEKKFRAWLNSDEAKPWRTREGRV